MAQFPPIAWIMSGVAGGTFLTSQLKDVSFLKKVDIPKTNIDTTPQFIPIVTTTQQENIMTEVKKFLLYSVIGSTSLYLLMRYIRKEDSFEKRIVPELIKSQSDTLSFVKDVDRKNETRLQNVEKNNRLRANKISNDIRSETRTNFDIVSSQLYGLTQVVLKTLSTVNDVSVKNLSDKDKIQQHKEISQFLDKAHSFNKVLSSDDYWKKSHQFHLEKIHDTVPQLITLKHMTPQEPIKPINKKMTRKKSSKIKTYSVIGGIGIGAAICGITAWKKN
jgi:hypothetical protein